MNESRIFIEIRTYFRYDLDRYIDFYSYVVVYKHWYIFDFANKSLSILTKIKDLLKYQVHCQVKYYTQCTICSNL